jgi:hypothetical protein
MATDEPEAPSMKAAPADPPAAAPDMMLVVNELRASAAPDDEHTVLGVAPADDEHTIRGVDDD